MVIIFTGISGVDSSAVLTKFINENKDYRYPNKKPILLKLEDEITTIYFEENPDVARNKHSWLQIILQQPYSSLKDYWLEACKRIKKKIDEILQDDGNALVFINLHACYFHVKTQEYISLVDVEFLKNLNPHKIITLIDDIYEVYHRLTKLGGLYNLMRKVSKSEVIFRHIRLLDWRAKETMMAKFLSEQINGCQHFVIATKHSFEMLTSLIKGELKTAYLSHPISEVRRLEANGDDIKAIKIKKEISDISRFLSLGYTTFLPTTIDEYRISFNEEATANGKKTVYYADLGGRWENDKYVEPREMLYECSGFPKDSQLWGEEVLPEQHTEDLNALLSVLAKTISLQVTVRDYTLVEQSAVLVIYRPLFNGNLAGGVKKEFNYFKHIRTAKKKVIACFIYCPKEDIDQFYINEFNARVKYFIALSENGIKFKNEKYHFDGLSTEQCAKLLRIGVDKNQILEFLSEVLDDHGMFIDVSTVIKPLNDVEVQVEQQFLENFVEQLLKIYQDLDDYEKISTYFETSALTADRLYDKIIETLNR